MRRLWFILVLALFGCATYDTPQDEPPARGGRGGGYQRAAARDLGPMLLEIVPDDTWWRDLRLAEPLNLTNDQLQALDKIAADQRDEIARLERDLPIATRDFRDALLIDPAVQADITSAAQRVRSIRDSIFDRQAQMIADERLILTKQQWSKLLDELQARRDERMNRNEGGYPRGGRGGYPRGGRGRPWP
ncbi:MAG TPA: hypothetical protein VLV78_02415 [Thermoanaerobaculia bacterium]|nr:hypothetical protein [Thermoanaerobaculia bacterium]